MKQTIEKVIPEFLQKMEDAEASPSQPNNFVGKIDMFKHKPTEYDETLCKADMAAWSVDDADSFSSVFMSLKVTESALGVLETHEFKSAVHASPDII